jgi:hypothetical protein
MKTSLPQSAATLDAGVDARGQEVMIKGVENDAFTAVLDPKTQDDGAWIRTNREKCAAFVTLVDREVQEACQRIDAREQDEARGYAAVCSHRCVGRLRRLSAGGWAISGGDPASRAGKQLFVAGGPQKDFRMVPCVECDAKGGIPAGSQVNGRAGEPVFVEIKNAGKG